MKTKLLFTIVLLLIVALSSPSYGEDSKNKTISGPFGSNPIQISIGKNGISEKKEPGYICDLNDSLGGGHYSEWGQTEEDARTIVTKKCSSKSGMLLCKKDKAICTQDK